MGEPKFTPGPWGYRTHEHDDWGVIRGGPENYPIAKVNVVGFSDDELNAHRDARTDPVEGTGRLMTAALDLYEACSALAFSHTEIPPPGVAVEDWRAAVLAARAARSKARGEPA